MCLFVMIVVVDREVDSTENVMKSCDFSCVATFQKKNKKKEGEKRIFDRVERIFNRVV